MSAAGTTGCSQAGGDAHAGAGGGGVAGGAGERRAEIHARFQIEGESAEQTAAIASELIERLQQLSHRTDCECDLDVDLGRRS